ncbi:hypothetical protein [Marinobacter sp. OP 3.4]|uniref:hypothetical protein n=1 Tax=Marinobacter sp. OP 3.4 TaxID=3076501 RepID=UPI002E1D0EE3
MVVDQEQYKADCLTRWNRLKDEATQKLRLYQAKNITRQELEDWLKSHSARDEQTLRGMINRMRGK